MAESDPVPRILTLGEPLFELSAAGSGRLRDVSRYEVGWGGDVSNFAVAACRLGGTAGIVTRIGDDEFGASFLSMWAAEGVDVRHVRTTRDGFTGVYFISRDEDGVHGFTYLRKGSAASRLRPGDVPLDAIRQCDAFHASGITQAISNSACDATFRAIGEARAAGVLVSYDPNVRLALWSEARCRATVLHTLTMADIALPSLEDARLVTGLHDPRAICELILSMGPGTVALKLGAEGSMVASLPDAAPVLVSGFRVSTVDSSGAGDTYDAAFVLSQLEGATIEESARLANAASALTTTGAGCVIPIPNRPAVERLLDGQPGAA